MTAERTTASLGPTTRFSDRVADYDRARPRYPDRLVDLLAGEAGIGPDAVVADIGAGTGLSAEPFLRRGNAVICVEPNAAMRLAAEALLDRYPGFRSVDGTAERTGLDDDTVDLVLAAQAFHWFDPDRARAEFRRILRPGGPVALVWNARRTRGSGFLEGYEALLRRHGTDYDRVRERTERLAGADALARFFGGGFERRVLENGQALDLEGLRSRLRSVSYTPTADDARYAPMMADLAALFERQERDGQVRIEYDLEVFWGRPAA